MQKTSSLDKLQPKSKCIVKNLTADGLTRRRLMDLGFVPGSEVEVVRKSLAGDPTAYTVRGAVIALRREEAKQIKVKKLEEV